VLDIDGSRAWRIRFKDLREAVNSRTNEEPGRFAQIGTTSDPGDHPPGGGSLPRAARLPNLPDRLDAMSTRAGSIAVRAIAVNRSRD
jgi:hypothetical protein